MPVPHRTITSLLAALALGFGASACSTDDAAERDAKDAQEEVEKSNADEKAGEAADDAGNAAEDAAKDVDGK